MKKLVVLFLLVLFLIVRGEVIQASEMSKEEANQICERVLSLLRDMDLDDSEDASPTQKLRALGINNEQIIISTIGFMGAMNYIIKGKTFKIVELKTDKLTEKEWESIDFILYNFKSIGVLLNDKKECHKKIKNAETPRDCKNYDAKYKKAINFYLENSFADDLKSLKLIINKYRKTAPQKPKIKHQKFDSKKTLI